jgi:hypothetical protein
MPIAVTKVMAGSGTGSVPAGALSDKIDSRLAPRIGTATGQGYFLPDREAIPLICYFRGVSDGIRTHDIQDHNLAL